MYDVIVVGARVAGSPTAMLLARAGHRVLLVDRDSFPSDTMSTHYIHQPGIAALKRWGLLDQVIASGCPPVTRGRWKTGPIAIEGFGPAVDGIAEAYVPRRYVLDKILIDGARAAGAEVREGFSVQELLTDDGVVTGIRGRGADGVTVDEHARVVVGADGLHSLVARAVNAPTYNERPALTCYYYSYWQGVAVQSIELGADDGSVYVGFPTNNGSYCAIAGIRNDRFHEYRADIEGTFFRTLEGLSPTMAEHLRGGKRVERWVGTADLPNFFRKPFGPGWALVGDAGYHKDPITGYGITDAFRDAEFLASALDAGLSGRTALLEALAGYEAERNAVAMPIYEFICQLATLDLPPPELMALLGAVSGNDEATTQFIGVIDGTVTVPEFFAPENVGRIMARAAEAVR